MNDKDQNMDTPNETNGDINKDRIDRDLLISRAIDEQASEADWAQLRRLGETDATVWRDLAEAQHEHTELCRALESAIAVADEIEVPVERFVQARFANRLRVVGMWGGWAVAAVLVLAMVQKPSMPGLSGVSGDSTSTAGLAGPRLGEVTPNEALQRYIDEGRRTGQVLEEIPERVLIETRPIAGGNGVEVIFIRQFIERTRVHTLYRTGQDEFGRWISLPIEIEQVASDPL